jgi:hypothetical protein
MKLPGPSTVKEERAQLKKWEVVYEDTSGKFQVKSARGYFYYSMFVDRKDDEKISIGHGKKRHLQLLSCSILCALGVGRGCLFQMGQAKSLKQSFSDSSWIGVANMK